VKGRDLGKDGRIILKWILKKYGVRVYTKFIWFKTGDLSTVMKLGTIKGTKFLD